MTNKEAAIKVIQDMPDLVTYADIKSYESYRMKMSKQVWSSHLSVSVWPKLPASERFRLNSQS